MSDQQTAVEPLRLTVDELDVLLGLAETPGSAISAEKLQLGEELTGLSNRHGISSLAARNFVTISGEDIETGTETTLIARNLENSIHWIELAFISAVATEGALIITAPRSRIFYGAREAGTFDVTALHPDSPVSEAVTALAEAFFALGSPAAVGLTVTGALGERFFAIRANADESWEIATGPADPETGLSPKTDVTRAEAYAQLADFLGADSVGAE